LDSSRTVAIADVHGDPERLTQILRSAGLVDDRLGWSGGAASLVLVGDLVDRGSRSREVLDLVMRLQEEAPRQVRVLLGNHEVMNLTGDLRYVPMEEYRAYATPASESLRESRYKSYGDFLGRRARRLGFEQPALDEGSRRAWMEAHPPGFFERRDAFRSGGLHGRWLRGLDAALVQDGTIFVHGGLSETQIFPSVQALNDRVRREISRFDELWGSLSDAGVLWQDLTLNAALELLREELTLWEAIDSLPAERVDPAARAQRPPDKTLQQIRELLGFSVWTIASPEGPLWYRGLAVEPEAELGPKLERVLRHYGADRVVVGHTPTADHRIQLRLRGKVFAIDTGLSAAVGGRPSALEIREGRFVALYPGEESVLLQEPGTTLQLDGNEPQAAPGLAGHDALRGLSLERIETFLRSAPIVSVRKIGTGVTKPSRATLDDGALRHDAHIQTVHSCEEITRGGQRQRQRVCDSYKYNLAAYELGKLLGISSIPPCVERRFDGRDAAFTWWIEDAVTFAEMKERSMNPPDGAAWNREQWIVGVFDELIYNTDRNRGNLLVDPGWRIWIIDHTRAFRTDRRLRDPGLLSRMRLDASLLASLHELTRESLERCCGAYLTSEEMKGVLARRDGIVARFDSQGDLSLRPWRSSASEILLLHAPGGTSRALVQR
jgi:hypothetical protein